MSDWKRYGGDTAATTALGDVRAQEIEAEFFVRQGVKWQGAAENDILSSLIAYV